MFLPSALPLNDHARLVTKGEALVFTQLARCLADTAANLGALDLRQRLQELEYAGRQAEWPATDRARLAVDRKWHAAREELQLLQGGPS